MSGHAVVTGASTGIGHATALHLDSLGFSVWAGVRKEADAQRIAVAGSDRLRPLTIDVTDAASIAAAAETVGDAAGASGLAALVNNAGVAVSAPVEFVPIDQLRHQLEVNLIGQVAVTQAFLPQLRRRAGGWSWSARSAAASGCRWPARTRRPSSRSRASATPCGARSRTWGSTWC